MSVKAVWMLQIEIHAPIKNRTAIHTQFFTNVSGERVGTKGGALFALKNLITAEPPKLQGQSQNIQCL